MIYIIRHGQTELNSRHVLQGRTDAPLNAVGVAQAKDASRRLRQLGIRFDRVFSSPLLRAIQTAEIVAPGVPIQTDPRLIEMEYGPYEGMDLKSPSPEVVAFFSDFIHHPAPQGMEPLSDVVARAGAFMRTLRAASGDILISTHAIAMKGILEALTPDPGGAYWSKYIGNCAVYAVSNDGGVFGIPTLFTEAGETP